MTTRFDTRFEELQQARAMLIRLLDDGNPLPPVQGVDDLSTDEVLRLLVACSTEVILHMVALIAEFDPAKARSIWMGLSADAVRRLEDLCQRTTKPNVDGSSIWTAAGGGHTLSGDVEEIEHEQYPSDDDDDPDGGGLSDCPRAH
jgi:hypothetical protein